jgi:hypothetical protein
MLDPGLSGRRATVIAAELLLTCICKTELLGAKLDALGVQPPAAGGRIEDEEVNESEETDQAREYQRSENVRAAIAVYSDLGFHVDGQYLPIAHLACAKGHALQQLTRRRRAFVVNALGNAPFAAGARCPG